MARLFLGNEKAFSVWKSNLSVRALARPATSCGSQHLLRVKVGAPVVEGASVSAKVIKNGKGKKLNIITYRAKKHSARRMGHRQPYTKVEITAING